MGSENGRMLDPIKLLVILDSGPEIAVLHCKIAISGPGSKISNNFIGSKLGQFKSLELPPKTILWPPRRALLEPHIDPFLLTLVDLMLKPGLAWEREARRRECCWQAWDGQQVLLLMLGMQVSTGLFLEYWERCKSCKSCTSWERCEPSKICESCECCECCKSYKSRIHSWQPIAQLE